MSDVFAAGHDASNEPCDDDKPLEPETSGGDENLYDLLDGLLVDRDDSLTQGTNDDGADELDRFVEPGSNLVGTLGNDTIIGWNELYGGSGDDNIKINNFGGEYQAVGTAYGGLGEDTILAEAGSDNDGQLFGGAGDDLLVGHAGAYFDAGLGDDTVVALSTTSQDGQILTGGGNDVVIVQPFVTNSREGSDPETVTLRVEDFDGTKDSLGILVDPLRLADLNIVAETVNDGSDTKLSLFVSDKVNGIEVNAPIQVILSGISDASNLDLKLYKMISETEYECIRTTTVGSFL